MIQITESTPCSRRSPNVFYIGDVLWGTVRSDGQPFKGRVTRLSGNSAVLANGSGGSQWVEKSSLRLERA